MIWAWLPVVLLLAACQSTAAGAPDSLATAVQPSGDPSGNRGIINTRFTRRYTGKIIEPALSEISGMAASQRDPNILWVINDSDHRASLFAIDAQGTMLREYATNVTNRDWESLTSLTLAGRPYLLLGDSGDNLGVHENYQLHLFEEPDLAEPVTADKLSPVATTPFVYADGHHNSEALAWSPVDNQILLISKQSRGASVYATGLATQPEPDSVFSAQRLGAVAPPPQSVSDALLSNLSGVEMSQITGLEIDPESRNAYVLTYRGIYHYGRREITSTGTDKSASTKQILEDWGTTFSRTPRLLARHTLSQAEALALSPHSRELWFTSEKLPAPLWRMTPRVK